MTELADCGRPRRAPGVRFQWEPAQRCHVLLYPEGMVRMNRSAGEILALVDGQRDIRAIIARLQQRFPDTEALANDVLEFLEDARAQRWITF